MSNKRLTAVWEHSEQKGTKLLALLSLADRSDDDGFCWPSHRDTAQRARTSRSYVVRIIDELATESGELYVHKRLGKTHQYLVLPGMSDKEIAEAMEKRFGYSEDEIKEKLMDLRGVNSTDMLTLQTGGVNSTGQGVLTLQDTNPKEPLKEPKEDGDDFFDDLIASTEDAEASEDLSRVQADYVNATKIPKISPGSNDYGDWIDGLKRLKRISATKEEMLNAVAILKRIGYSYHRPGSLVNTILKSRDKKEEKRPQRRYDRIIT